MYLCNASKHYYSLLSTLFCYRCIINYGLQLQSGKQCLCRYVLPSSLSKDRLSHNLDFRERASVSHDLKIIGVADAIEGRINIVVNSGQVR